MMCVEKGKYNARGILLDLHAAMAADNTDDKPISGTALVRAYRLDESAEQQHTVASDIESVFISLLHVLSGGEALPWRHLDSEEMMRAVKCNTMFDPAKWRRALQHCPADYHAALERMHTAIFKGSVAQYMQQPVTAHEVLQILEEEADRLGRK